MRNFILLAAVFAFLTVSCGKKTDISLGNVQVSMEEDYGMASDVGQKILIRDRMEAFLELCGYSIVSTPPSVAQITVIVKGVPTLEKYASNLQGYTGAELHATIRMENSTGISQEETVSCVIPPLAEIRGGDNFSKPSDAPFLEAMEKSRFMETFAFLIGETNGPEPLVRASLSKGTVWLGKGSARTPFRGEGYACEALRDLTGKNYGDDGEVWDMWWRKNKGKL